MRSRLSLQKTLDGRHGFIASPIGTFWLRYPERIVYPAKWPNSRSRSRRARALTALAEEAGNRNGPELGQRKQAQAAEAWSVSAPFRGFFRVTACLRQRGACGKNRPACWGLFGPILFRSRACCR